MTDNNKTTPTPRRARPRRGGGDDLRRSAVRVDGSRRGSQPHCAPVRTVPRRRPRVHPRRCNKGPAGSVHTVWYGDPDDALIVAVTGNGPTSEANAKHIAWSSPRNVTALIAEVRRLRAKLAEVRS